VSEPALARVRIIVALDPESQHDADIGLIASVVAGREVELLGLFVSDTRVLAHAQSSLAREIAWSGSFRRLEAATLESQIRLRAADARRRFEAMARRLGMPHDFQLTQGDAVDEIERIAEPADVLVVTVAEGSVGTRAWWGASIHDLARARATTVVFVRTVPRAMHGPVIVVSSAADFPTAMPIAARLARRLGTTLLIAQAVGDARDREQTAIDETRGLTDVRVVSLADSAAEIARLTNAVHATAVVLPSHDPAASGDRVRELLRQTRSAIVLVRAANP
jgi:hypothetical protein